MVTMLLSICWASQHDDALQQGGRTNSTTVVLGANGFVDSEWPVCAVYRLAQMALCRLMRYL